jgi:hypothetical protein
MADMKGVGSIGLKALIYFEVVLGCAVQWPGVSLS